MPTINKPEKKPKSTYHSETDDRILRKKLYNSTAWRKCRQAHLVREPLCQQCLKEGKVNAGSCENPLQVHHKQSPFVNGEINHELAFSDWNLETICSYHHGLEHSGGERSPEEILSLLEELLDGNFEDDENSGSTCETL